MKSYKYSKIPDCPEESILKNAGISGLQLFGFWDSLPPLIEGTIPDFSTMTSVCSTPKTQSPLTGMSNPPVYRFTGKPYRSGPSASLPVGEGSVPTGLQDR